MIDKVGISIKFQLFLVHNLQFKSLSEERNIVISYTRKQQ